MKNKYQPAIVRKKIERAIEVIRKDSLIREGDTVKTVKLLKWNAARFYRENHSNAQFQLDDGLIVDAEWSDEYTFDEVPATVYPSWENFKI